MMSGRPRILSLTLVLLLALSVVIWNEYAGKNEVRLLPNGPIQVVNPMLGAQDKSKKSSRAGWIRR